MTICLISNNSFFIFSKLASHISRLWSNLMGKIFFLKILITLFTHNINKLVCLHTTFFTRNITVNIYNKFWIQFIVTAVDEGHMLNILWKNKCWILVSLNLGEDKMFDAIYSTWLLHSFVSNIYKIC